jgi:hypothetical protein
VHDVLFARRELLLLEAPILPDPRDARRNGRNGDFWRRLTEITRTCALLLTVSNSNDLRR